MKRFFTIVAAALMTSAFASAAFAGWGPNGMYGNADPNARPVGQSSKPSTNPASAPILNPPDPTKNLGAVPGSYKDPAMQATHSKAWQAMQYAKAKAAFDKKNNSPKLAPEKPFVPLTPPMNSGYGQSSSTGSGYGGNGSMKPQYPNSIPYMPTSNHQTSGYGGNNGGFFGNDTPGRHRPTNNYPEYPTNMNNNYPQYPSNNYPTTNNYPSKQSQLPMGGYGQGTSGYGGQSSNSGYGMFAR